MCVFEERFFSGFFVVRRWWNVLIILINKSNCKERNKSEDLALATNTAGQPLSDGSVFVYLITDKLLVVVFRIFIAIVFGDCRWCVVEEW